MIMKTKLTAISKFMNTEASIKKTLAFPRVFPKFGYNPRVDIVELLGLAHDEDGPQTKLRNKNDMLQNINKEILSKENEN